MFETAKPFLLSLALGLMIGIERERSFTGSERHVPFGARTFTLIALLGTLAAYLGNAGLAVVLASFIAAIAIAASSRTRRGLASRRCLTSTPCASSCRGAHAVPPTGRAPRS